MPIIWPDPKSVPYNKLSMYALRKVFFVNTIDEVRLRRSSRVNYIKLEMSPGVTSRTALKLCADEDMYMGTLVIAGEVRCLGHYGSALKGFQALLKHHTGIAQYMTPSMWYTVLGMYLQDVKDIYENWQTH